MAEQTYPKRTTVKVNDLNGAFLITRIGNRFQTQYGGSYPVEATLADGTEATIFVNEGSVIGRQVKDGEIATQAVYEVVESTSKNGRQYRALRSIDG
jgi:hypothetical protein